MRAPGQRLAAVGLAMSMGCLPAALASGAEVALVAAGVPGAARAAWPVTAGIPFPAGALRPGDGVRLLDAAGREAPLQAQPTTWWPDGSVRSLLLDAQVDLLAGGAASLRLEFGAGVRRPSPPRALRVEETAERIVIETGAARITLNRQAFPLVAIGRGGDAAVWLDDGVILDESRKTLDIFSARAGRLHRVVLEGRGPLRATVLAEGEHAGPEGAPIPYRVRLHAYAGQAFVRLEHFLANPEGRLGARQIALRLGTRLREACRYAFGGEGGRRIEGAVPAGEGVALWQAAGRGGRAYEVGSAVGAAPPIARGRDAQGWAQFGAGEGAVAVALEDFEGPYAHGRGFALTRDCAIEIYLAGPGSKVPFGMTSRMAVGLAGGDDGLGLALAQRAYAVAPASWYAASGVLGPLIPLAADRAFPAYRATAARALDQAWRRREFGSYYDVARSWFNLFAMTGDARALRLGHQAATVHWDHDMQHTGPRRGIRDVQDARHLYTEGPLAAWLFTGDALALDMAREVADGILARLPAWEGYVQGYNERSGGWPLISLVAAYEATLDERYLRGARWIVDRVLTWQHPTRGGWIRTYEDPQECPLGGQGGSPFMTAILMEGLYRYYRVSTDARLPASLWRAADWLIRETWWPSLGRPRVQTFLYIQCREKPGTSMGYGETWDLNPMIAAGLAAAYRVAADPRHLEVALQAFRAGVARFAPPPAGKHFAQFFRSSGIVLAQAQAPGTREVPAGRTAAVGGDGSPAAGSPAAPPAQSIAGPWARVDGLVAPGRTPRPPALDGRLDPEEWAAAARISRFVLPGGEGVAREQTVVHVMADGEALYLGFEATQARPPAPPSSVAGRRLWTEDSVEIFLAPDAAGGRYYQFIAGADGARYQSLGRLASWQGPWEAAPGRTATGWTLEVRIPLASVGGRPEGEWGFNVCRNQAGDGERSCWVAPLGPYHNPHRFGRLALGGMGLAFDGEALPGAGAAGRRIALRIEQRDAEGGLLGSQVVEMVLGPSGATGLPPISVLPAAAELRLAAREEGAGVDAAREILRRSLVPAVELATIPGRFVVGGQAMAARSWVRAAGPVEARLVLEGGAGSPRLLHRWQGAGPAVLDVPFAMEGEGPGQRMLHVELRAAGSAEAWTAATRSVTVVEGF